ncbi:MAG: hypothetical protein ACXIUM_15790 [Wenzhouxiangella sp.]
MNFFSAAVAIMAIIAVTEITKKWLKARQARPEDLDRIEQTVESLRERVETLERIVTDQRETLRRKFDEL